EEAHCCAWEERKMGQRTGSVGKDTCHYATSTLSIIVATTTTITTTTTTTIIIIIAGSHHVTRHNCYRAGDRTQGLALPRFYRNLFFSSLFIKITGIFFITILIKFYFVSVEPCSHLQEQISFQTRLAVFHVHLLTLHLPLQLQELVELTLEWHLHGTGAHCAEPVRPSPSPRLMMSQLLPKARLWTRRSASNQSSAWDHLPKLELLDPEASHAEGDACRKRKRLGFAHWQSTTSSVTRDKQNDMALHAAPCSVLRGGLLLHSGDGQ
uniref:Uncharacterized protein n=1 Tax=Rattus norvegicus TaxID=10116 RepID=F1LP88_RAT